MVTDASARDRCKVKYTCIWSHLRVKLTAIIATLTDVFDRLTIVHLCFWDKAWCAMIVLFFLTEEEMSGCIVPCTEAVASVRGQVGMLSAGG